MDTGVSYVVVVLCVCCDVMLWRCYHTAAHSGLGAVLGCGGKKWDWEHQCLPPAAVISRTHPSPDIRPTFSTFTSSRQQHMCWPESAAWVQLKAVLCLQSPIRWPGGHRAGVLCKQASWHVNYLIKLCQWFIGDPNLPMSYPWHKKIMFFSDKWLWSCWYFNIYTYCL